MIQHLKSSTVSVVVDVSSGIPTILHWGQTLADLPQTWGSFPVTFGAMDSTTPISVVPLHGDAFTGRPGLQGHRRGGRHWSPRFSYLSHEVIDDLHGTLLECVAHDLIAELEIVSCLHLSNDGVLTARCILRNVGDSPFMLDAFTVSLPLASHAEDLGVFGGRWGREFELQKFPWPYGAWTSENRFGRSSHEHPSYVWALQSGATEWQGEVWGVHAAWSANHVIYAEKLPDGRRYIQCGELFHAGEICVYAGDEFSTVDVIGVYSDSGMTPASWGFHNEARRRSPRFELSARPVHLNTWEAVYFNHDIERLKELATAGAAVGIERFVLDDGWFAGRRNDRQGLGDWWVSSEVYPDGLNPLIDHVRALDMQFGIWVEPEMVNPDSDLYRAHPEWVLATEGYEPILGRHQLVLDLWNAGAFEHVLTQLDALLRDHDIDYVKWDMNRWHVQGSNPDGKAGTHDQTVALYALLDRLRELHPSVEFESCASGGGRIDHAILSRVERVWTSDSNDALDRQLIQRGASMLIPPEVMGSHIGAERSHTTGRRHSMSFRGATALFGHLGVESDVTQLRDSELEQLRHIIGVYKKYRYLLHGGDTVRFDTFELTAGAGLSHGVYSLDRRQALVAYCQLSSDVSLTPPMWRLPGLLEDALYEVQIVPLTTATSVIVPGAVVRQPEWLSEALRGAPATFTGRYLEVVGLQAPVMWPETAVLVYLSCS